MVGLLFLAQPIPCRPVHAADVAVKRDWHDCCSYGLERVARAYQ